MGRRRKYFTKDEKNAANRAKSKRHYEKARQEINKARRKVHQRAMRKRKDQSSSLLSDKLSQVVVPKQPEKVWLEEVKRVKRRYMKHIGGDVLVYIKTVCTRFMEMEDMDDLRDHTTALSNFQGSLYHHQSEILQLEGLGDSWVEADGIVKEICTTLSWVEEIYCAALIGPQEVCNEYTKGRFLFQRVLSQ